jgi:aryl-alcohol dehydrogenase
VVEPGRRFLWAASFATHALAHERNVVKLPNNAPLSLVGPLGCGIQTGAGVVMNSLDVPSGASLVIAGAGPVGLAAVMAAAIRGVESIVVIEPRYGRRAVSLDLGVTHALDPVTAPISEQVRRILPGGMDYAVDTTVALPVLEQILLSLGVRGTLGLVGVPSNAQAALPLGLTQSQLFGLTVPGVVEGDADPQTFIPYLLDLHRDGRFPFDKLITTTPLAQINEAIEAQARGDVIKVVLVNE